ncbi:hypothetical protein OH76DRAFT_1199270 [Lentinus brumalis]|uniref:Uncharacterized protein n=1 Tax=Lentinus brumalis TaxID=2498619 RepID=A0A371CTD8_9APHY|nr:hypothetical protein OH76DRAFT_1199270 [Polyporus brumalis]
MQSDRLFIVVLRRSNRTCFGLLVCATAKIRLKGRPQYDERYACKRPVGFSPSRRANATPPSEPERPGKFIPCVGEGRTSTMSAIRVGRRMICRRIGVRDLIRMIRPTRTRGVAVILVTAT